MIAFFVFLAAAFIVLLGARLTNFSSPTRGGISTPLFAVAILTAACSGWMVDSVQRLEAPLNEQRVLSYLPEAAAPENAAPAAIAPNNSVSLPTRRGIPADGLLFLLAALLCALSAIRVRLQKPPWLADVMVITASICALAILSALRRAYGTAPLDGPFFGFGALQFCWTLVLMWAITRVTTGLNRVPQASGGYFGVVALFIVAFLHQSGSTLSFFPFAAGAAIAGAGLASVPLALKNADFNLGWPTALTTSFLLAQTVFFGLPDFTVQSALGLSLLILALPLTDVLFYRVRRRGTGDTSRLHQGLQARGLSSTKIALFYTAIGLWLALMGYLLFGLHLGGAWLQFAARLMALIFIALGGFLLFYSLARILMRRTPDEKIPAEIEAFGVKISAVTMPEALAKIEGFIESRAPHHVVTCDANSILCARQDPEYAGIVQRAALASPDGYGVIWGMRLLNLPIYERVTGVDMVTGICEFSAQKNYSIYILGSEKGENGQPGIAEIAAKNLAEKYPGLRIAGTHHGYWRRDRNDAILTQEDDERIAEAVRLAAPDVLFVAMGIPLQEKFIAAQMQRMNAPVSLGVGGSFDVYSGKFERAPLWVQRIGMEWLYRVIIDPSRWKRMGYVPRFMILAIKAWLRGGKTD